MSTLITGAGLVGSCVTARLLADGGTPVLFDVAFSQENLADHFPLDEVPLVRGDVTDFSEVAAALHAHQADEIVHTASFLTSAVTERPAAGVRVNLLGTFNVLEAARLAGARRVVFCGANTVSMGRLDPQEKVVEEDFSMRVESERPPTIYGTLKLASEWLCQNYGDAYGLRAVTLRLGGVFGPWRGSPSGGPSRLLKAVIETAWAGRPVRLTAGDRIQAMDFVYAEDVAQAICLVLRAEAPSAVYNVSTGRLCTVDDVLGILAERLGRAVEVEAVESGRSSGSYRPGLAIGIDRARAELGYEPAFPIEAAIDHYLAWLARNGTG